jgi:hypothetical protein
VEQGASPALLDSYEEERGAVGRALLRFTGRGLKMAATANPLLEKFRDLLLPWLSSPQSVQDSLTGFIAETAIEYRSSSIVAEHGGDGDLKAGDRMPDLGLRKAGFPSSLLEDWTDGRHLVLLVNASAAEEH